MFFNKLPKLSIPNFLGIARNLDYYENLLQILNIRINWNTEIRDSLQVQEVLNKSIKTNSDGILYFLSLTLYSAVLLFYTPEKIRIPKGFLMFSWGIEKQHRV